MKKALSKVLGSCRVLYSITAVLVLCIAFLSWSVVQKRSRTAHTEGRVRATQESIADLEVRLARKLDERARSMRATEGQGPGGVHASSEEHLFTGPTEARSAFELVLAADAAGFRRLKYTAEPTLVARSFPPGTDGMESTTDTMTPTASALNAMERRDLVAWPIRLSVDSDWSSIVSLVGRVVEARPSFGIHTLEIEVQRDGQGNAIDELSLESELVTCWVQARGGA